MADINFTPSISSIKKPYDLSFISAISPIILIIIVVSASIVFQNLKGFIYLGFLMVACIIRSFIYNTSNINKQINNLIINNDKCNQINYGAKGETFSIFVFSFTMLYIAYPMFTNGIVNFWVPFSILFAGCLDLAYKFTNGCFGTNSGDIYSNILSGSLLAAFITWAMTSGGSGKYLFFNELSSSNEVCYKPKNQTFKCSVYKNGELIGAV